MNPSRAAIALTMLLSTMVGLGMASRVQAQTASPTSPTATVKRTVLEDASTRIEELRVDGQPERVVVKSKRVNLPAWEIRPNSPGRMNAADSRLPNDSANQRMWSVLSF